MSLFLSQRGGSASWDFIQEKHGRDLRDVLQICSFTMQFNGKCDLFRLTIIDLCGERKALVNCLLAIFRPLPVYTSIPILSSIAPAKNFQMLSLTVKSCLFTDNVLKL